MCSLIIMSLLIGETEHLFMSKEHFFVLIWILEFLAIFLNEILFGFLYFYKSFIYSG